jgi:hypothetical protein
LRHSVAGLQQSLLHPQRAEERTAPVADHPAAPAWPDQGAAGSRPGARRRNSAHAVAASYLPSRRWPRPSATSRRTSGHARRQPPGPAQHPGRFRPGAGWRCNSASGPPWAVRQLAGRPTCATPGPGGSENWSERPAHQDFARTYEERCA